VATLVHATLWTKPSDDAPTDRERALGKFAQRFIGRLAIRACLTLSTNLKMPTLAGRSREQPVRLLGRNDPNATPFRFETGGRRHVRIVEMKTGSLLRGAAEWER